jgi:hypothetical protein
MSSWASIAKRNIPALDPSKIAGSAPGPAPGPAPRPTQSKIPESKSPMWEYAQAQKQRELELQEQAQRELEIEERSQCRPNWFRLRRPDAPTVCPIFRTSEDHDHWSYNESIKNHAYSNEVFERRMTEWRTRINWQLPPMKTTVSPDETRRGFYHSKIEGLDVVKYVTPHSTGGDLQHEGIVNMMWCLIHSRADELVACNTVADFNALFEQTVRFEYPDYGSRMMSRMMRRSITPLKLLWLFSQKANVFPGKARPGTARWTVDPSSLFRAPVFDPTVYTKSMVFFNLQECRGIVANGDMRATRDTKTEFIVGAMGGRDETGICVVERLKQMGNEAKIRWLLSAKQLREMERIVFSPEYDPFRFFDSDDCDWSDEYW